MGYSFGPFVLDLEQRLLFKAGVEVRLQPKAFELLRVLVDHAPRALGKDEILAAVWPGTFVSENNLATLVRDLRASLDDDAQTPRFIRTAHGFGYAFIGETANVSTGGKDSNWRLIHEHREIRLREGDNLLGRSGADVIVFDSPSVSRHHARLLVKGAEVIVEDLGSKNGTWANGHRISTPVALASGAEIRLGLAVVTLRSVVRDGTTLSVTDLRRPG